MELELQSFFGLYVHSCTHWLRTRNPAPLSPHLGSYTRAQLVSQDRLHLFCDPLFVYFMYLRAIFCTFHISVDFYIVPVGGREGEGARERGIECIQYCMGTLSVLTVPIQLVTHTVSVLTVPAIF
jgi:hypothetical protein